MNDRIRASDGDHVTARLRDHFAEGRLSSEELDERISATLSARTFGDLRRVTADLPGPALAPPLRAPRSPQWTGRSLIVGRRRPRILPLLLVLALVALLVPGAGWLLFALVKLFLLLWLVACVAGFVAVVRLRRRWHRNWQATYAQHWRG
jgi:hypothetical protein